MPKYCRQALLSGHPLKILPLSIFLLSSAAILLPSALFAQEQQVTPGSITKFKNEYPDLDSFAIDTIAINGNKQTKRKVILRELKFRESTKLPLKNLEQFFEENEKLVMNTRLFVNVALLPEWQEKGRAGITVNVDERWYTFPVPMFELADRNFNEWWVNRDHDLSRTMYGLRFYQDNIRGRNEQLKAFFTLGFTERFGFRYHIPFIDSSQTWGLQVRSEYAQNKKMAYSAKGNELVFHFDDHYLRKQYSASGRLIRRKNLRKRHILETRFHSNWVSDRITNRNPDYFGENANVMRYFGFRYRYEQDYRDRINYPRAGHLLRLDLEQLGLGIFRDVNQTFLTGKFHKFWPLGNKFYLASGVEGQYSFSSQQPFFLRRGLGFSQSFVRGYEYDVILGDHYLLNRNSLRYQLFDTELNNLSFIPFEQFRQIPLSLYLKVYADQGYVSDNNGSHGYDPLKDTYLAGSGVGLDLVTYYDIVLRFEYSFNKNLENDLFLHFVKAF